MAKGKTIGARFSDDESAWLERRAAELGLKGAGAAVAHIVRAAVAADVHPVLATLPAPPAAAPAPKSRRSGRAEPVPVTSGVLVNRHGFQRVTVEVPAATPSAPPPGGGRVSALDLPLGRDRPAYGSMLKGPGKPRR